MTDAGSEAQRSVNWSSYPIMRFDEVPPIEIVIVDRPSEESLGAGEATVGPERVKAALKEA